MPSKTDLNSFLGEMGETVVIYEFLKRRWNVFRNMGGRAMTRCSSLRIDIG
jgi:hypothetical protein